MATNLSAGTLSEKAGVEIIASHNLLAVCAWCKSALVKTGSSSRWVDMHDYPADTRDVSHGICPDCAAKVRNRT